jgi:hypothetical protein
MNSTSADDASTQAVFPSTLTLPLVGTSRVRLTTACFPAVTHLLRQNESTGVSRLGWGW